MRLSGRVLLVAILCIIACRTTQAAAQETRFKAGLTDRHKVEVSDPATLARLLAGGAELVADYGSFQRLVVSSAAFAANDAGILLNRDEENTVLLHAGPLDTTTTVAKARRHSLAAFGGRKLHLVQFAAPVAPQWFEDLGRTGVRIVTYIPNNAYLLYGTASEIAAVQTLAQTAPHIQWEGEYATTDRIHPAIQILSASSNALYAIQLVADDAANPATIALVEQWAPDKRLVRREAVLDYRNLIVLLPSAAIAAIAAQPDVVFIRPYMMPHKFDERQDQILAGNLTGTVPSGPGYLAWLASRGFTQEQFTASGFVVDVTDSGIDNGTTSPNHFGLYTGGNVGQPSRVAYVRLEGTANSGSTLQGLDGHGNLNSHVIAGYNDLSGWPHVDSTGYRYGLGVCPFVRVGSSVVFDPGTFTNPDYANLLSQAYHDGARISSDSWGSDTAGAYDTDAQAYDALVRDAQPSGSTYATAGNQEMTIVFAAGNAGSAAQTVGSPGTAKNVITVGASENVRSHSPANGGTDSAGNDGCSTADVDADNAGDIASFSSRGPCSDGRRKPEIVAPGTHITGGVAQGVRTAAGAGSAISGFEGSGVCGLPGGGTAGSPLNFFPTNQQFYTTSSGTSHSTPAVSGGAALVRQYFINKGWAAPSPAMTKAWLVNSARYLGGVSANDTLWSNNQGMGEMNLGAAFDDVPRISRDQLTNDLFTATGQARTFITTITNTNKPVRVTLTWTDAPGATSGNAYKNNLDLVITCGGSTYRGNVFSGAYSVTGGTADPRNNTESVFLPAGVGGVMGVTVSAANINSDGVPNYGGALDQDFALVVYNATAGASNQPPVLDPIGAKSTGVYSWLSFNVTASDATDGDPVTLAVSNLPPWATFPSATGTGSVSSLFAGMSASTGTWTTTILAYDKDGTNSETITLNIVPGGLATNVIDEGFDAGTTAPSGWTFTGIGGTYTTTGNYGRKSPSLKFDATGDRIESPTFSGGTNLTFWSRGQNVNASSRLLLEGLSNGIWATLVTYGPIPSNVARTNSVPLSGDITKLRFTYTKSAGNLALDDVIVNGVSGSGFVDANANGIPDGWEMAYFHSVTSATTTSDYDQDGFPDLYEFLAGTDPTNPASRLVFESVNANAGGDPVICWQGVTGRQYSVERSFNLPAGFAVIASNLPGMAPVTAYTNPVLTNGLPLFYRIKVQ